MSAWDFAKHLVGYTLAAAVPFGALVVAVVLVFSLDTVVAGIVGIAGGLCAVVTGQLLTLRWMERQP
jgi:predicted tellurium resistance membrane protein TerC